MARTNNTETAVISKNPAIDNYFYEICSCSDDEALAKLNSTQAGLKTEDAENALKIYGENLLLRGKRINPMVDLLKRFIDPLAILMLVIFVVICLTDYIPSSVSNYTDPGPWIVLGMLFVGVCIGFFRERASNKAAEELQKLIQTNAIVFRDGEEKHIPFLEVVPGDIVVLAAGSIIPADVRIISSKDFFLSQSALTGESMPVEKYAGPNTGKSKEKLDLTNACFQGSSVVSGAAKAVVIYTGMKTFLGSISSTLVNEKSDTSFDVGSRKFVWMMIRVMIALIVIIFLIDVITKSHTIANMVETILFALSVAIGLTPTMMPMIVTVCLSKGAIVMSKKKVIVKKLKAIQNFGAINILCTDKTGTLTQDNIILEKYVDVTNRQNEDVLRYAYMNSYYQTGLRNLLDRAILDHEELDVEKTCRKVDELPFDFVRKRMSVIIDYEDSHVLICKGAVEEVFSICESYQVDDEIYPLITMVKNDLMEEYQKLSADGYRVLAIAYKEFVKNKEVFSTADEEKLVLLGYVAFFDPPKDSSARAIEALNKSGVAVKILTGDNDLVTRKVCADVGIDNTTVITGGQLSAMNDAEFKTTVTNFNIFARLSPSQKEKIIKTLRELGNIVGFLGDGINDAPAMKAADVGISVDTAVDIAKESADIILLEKSLMVLEDGIIEGRKVFANIIKYIKMGSSSNFGNMFSQTGASIFLPFLPMDAIQILLLNFLYDISQTGIPTDNVDSEFIEKPHKWDIGFIQKFMVILGPTSSIFDYATFFLMLIFFNCALFSNPGTTPALQAHYQHLFHTGWFIESLLTQTMIVYIIRTNKVPFFQSMPSFFMTMTTAIIMVIGISLPYSPLASSLGMIPLPLSYWPWCIGFVITYCVFTHFVKVWFNKGYFDGLIKLFSTYLINPVKYILNLLFKRIFKRKIGETL